MINKTKYIGHFGDKESFFNSFYINYYLNEINKYYNLKDDEKRMIKHAKVKYYTINVGNFLFFLYSLRKIYKRGKRINYTHIASTREAFIFATYIAVIVGVYFTAQMCYYNDLKYLIKKYSYINKERFEDALLSRDIIKKYNYNS